MKTIIKWETKILPEPQDINDTCNTYYLVKIKGFDIPTMAMYLTDNNEEGWYINYYAKIAKEVIGWLNI